MCETEKLICTHNFNDKLCVKRGRISFCMIAYSPHFFIIVESGKYKNNVFVKDNRITTAFSYVPNSTNSYIGKKYKNKNQNEKKFYKSSQDDSLTTLSGYNPLLFTPSYIVDTWKLTDRFVRMKSKPIKNWRKYNRFQNFDTYNVFSIIPYNKICNNTDVITDCIGYSNFHYNFSHN